MFYVDTSLLVALHVPEPHSLAALSWLNDHSGSVLTCSDWGKLEFASALSRKLRTRRIKEFEREPIEQAFVETLAQEFMMVSVQPSDYATAGDMLRHHQTGLRSGDALHLAVAKRQAATLVTLDVTMTHAARYFDLTVSPVI